MMAQLVTREIVARNQAQDVPFLARLVADDRYAGGSVGVLPRTRRKTNPLSERLDKMSDNPSAISDLGTVRHA
jgi:hypothetical protein